MRSSAASCQVPRQHMLGHGCPRRSQCLVAMHHARYCIRNTGMACDAEAPIGQRFIIWSVRFAPENGIADAVSFAKMIRARGRSLSLMRCTYFRTTFQSTMPLWPERKSSPRATRCQFSGSSPKTSHTHTATVDCQETPNNRRISNGYNSMT